MGDPRWHKTRCARFSACTLPCHRTVADECTCYFRLICGCVPIDACGRATLRGARAGRRLAREQSREEARGAAERRSQRFVAHQACSFLVVLEDELPAVKCLQLLAV